MLKRILSIFLISILLMLPAAQAEQTTYTPYRPSLDLFSQAFAGGDMVLMDMNFQLSTNESLAALLDEEDVEILSVISKLLPQTTLKVGFGGIENGIRLLLAAQYAANEQEAALDLTLDLTKDGLSLVSSAIPGERLTAKWETLMTLCGVGAEEAAQIMSLRDADWDALMLELTAQLGPIMEMAGQIAAPYGETILNYFASLPTEVKTDVAAEGIYPAAATEICFSITQKSIGDLMTTLASQLEADATLCALLDAALAQSGEAITTAQLCQAVKSAAAESWVDETTPLCVYIGMDEAGNFLYALITSHVEGAPSLSLVCTPHEDSGLSLLALDYLVLTNEGNASDGFSFAALYPKNPDVNSILDLQLYLDIYEDETTLLSAESALAENHMTTEAGLPGIAGAYMLNLAIDDAGDTVNVAFAAESAQGATADGGESLALSAALEASAYEVTIPLTCEVSMMTTPGEGAPVSLIRSAVAAPALGIDEYAENYKLYTAANDLDSASLTETALESATEADLEALANRAVVSLSETLSTLMTLLPPEVAAMLQ